MDFLDICMGRYNQTCTGKYYKMLPDATEITDDAGNVPYGIPFDYEYVDVTTRAYKQLIGNLTESEGIVTAIKTREALEWKIGAFIILMDGKLCSVISINEDRSNTGKEAARILPIPLGTEYVLRLTEYENPRGLI